MDWLSQTGFTVRGPRAARLAVAALVLALAVTGLPSPAVADHPPHPAPVVGTPLPSGWEQCVESGVGAQPTPDDVADLDAWQQAEGGSTNNAAAFNPFNTRAVADPTGKPVAVTSDPGGFPAYATWADGCAATVATLLQPDMAPIVTALKAGNVSPPGLFLSDVDQSPWCAPSADGLPCYASEILSAQLLDAVLGGGANPVKATLTAFSGVGTTLHDYQQDEVVTAQDQQDLAVKSQVLVVAGQAVVGARQQLEVALRELRLFAVHDYMGDGAVNADSNLQIFGSSDERQSIAQYYGDVAVYVLTLRYDQARATLASALARQSSAATSVAQAGATLAAAQSQENQDYAALEADVGGIQGASGCAAAATPVTAAAGAAPGTPGAAGAGAPTATSSPATPPTTTTAPGGPAPATAAPATGAHPGPAATTTTTAGGGRAPAGAPVATAPAPPAPAPTVEQLWSALQSCLAGPPPAGAATAAPTLSDTGGG